MTSEEIIDGYRNTKTEEEWLKDISQKYEAALKDNYYETNSGFGIKFIPTKTIIQCSKIYGLTNRNHNT